MTLKPHPVRCLFSTRTVFALCLLFASVLAGSRAQASPAASGLSVTITSAPPSSTTSASATIGFAATNATITECSLDGGSYTRCNSPVGYSGLGTGGHTFVVRATRGGQNVSASAAWQVAGVPSFTVTSSIREGTALSGPVVWEATASQSVSKVEFYIDGASRWLENLAPYRFNGDPDGLLDTRTLSNGSHLLRIVATKADSSTSETRVTVSVSNAVAPPPPAPAFTVTSSIREGTALSGPVVWEATASQSVSKVEFYIDGASKWLENLAPYRFNGDPDGLLDTRTLSNGSHLLRIVATKADSSTSETRVTVSVSNAVAPPPPAPAFTVTSSIREGTALSGPVVWEATASQSVSKVEFYIDGASKWLENLAPYRFNGDPDGLLDTRTLSNGSHLLRIVATKADSSTSETRVTVSVSNAVATPPPVSPPPSAGGAGRVRYMEATSSASDPYTNSPSLAQQQWIRDHWQRSLVYAGYWDSKTSWYPNGWAYLDSYAIYRTSSLATQHPEWILSDASSNKLYIPWGCSGGVCPQYAADPGNAAWRQYCIDRLKVIAAQGYRGVFLDDVNMDRNVGNGAGQQVAPIDPRTGLVMSDTAWKTYFAEFVEQLRAAVPGVEIVHNSVWYAGGGLHDASNPSISRQVSAADYVDIERGFNDGGVTGGTGVWSVYSLMRYVDSVHALGAHVIVQSYAVDLTAAEYNLAGYFLVSDGSDLVSTSVGSLPDQWWSGYDTDLGDVSGPRYLWNGLWRRDFTGGFVLLNEPGASTKTVALGGSFKTTSGQSVSSLTLGAARGAVLAR